MIKRLALAQMNSGIDPADNAAKLRQYIADASRGSADIIFTPEMTGMLDRNRDRARANIRSEDEDIVLAAAREAAAAAQIWVAIGSLAIKVADHAGEKWRNRSYLINPQGQIAARYDKIHLFDVTLATGETWRESAAYDGGAAAIVTPIDGAMLGLSICYDVRFAPLYAALSDGGANILAIPAAFTVPTGEAHWEILLRARAIESAAFVVAAAQSGQHEDGRVTYGHSMVVDPWGKTLLDMGNDIGVGFCDIDMQAVADVRSRIPVLAHRRDFARPAPI